MNYGPGRKVAGGYSISFLAEDCRTSIGRVYQVRSRASLRDLVVRTKVPEDQLEKFDQALQAWNQGSVWLQLTEAQFQALGDQRPRP